MNNSEDNFEKIAQDAVGVLVDLAQAMGEAAEENDDPAAALLALIIGRHAEDLCERAIALGAE